MTKEDSEAEIYQEDIQVQESCIQALTLLQDIFDQPSEALRNHFEASFPWIADYVRWQVARDMASIRADKLLSEWYLYEAEHREEIKRGRHFLVRYTLQETSGTICRTRLISEAMDRFFGGCKRCCAILLRTTATGDNLSCVVSPGWYTHEGKPYKEDEHHG